MNKLIPLVSGLVWVFSFGIALAEPPAWYSDTTLNGKYTAQKFLVGVGVGKSLKEAENEAKRVLSESFRSEVRSQIDQNKKSEITDDTSGKTEGKDQAVTASNVLIRSEIVLRGVEIRERYHDKKAGEHYALAALDRSKAKMLYLKDLNRIRAQIDSRVARFEAKPNFKTLSEIEQRLSEFDRLNEEYAVLSSGLGQPRPIDESKFESLRDQLGSSLKGNKYKIGFVGNRNELEDLISECLKDRNLNLVDDASVATHFVDVVYSEKEEPIAVKGWQRFRYHLSVKIRTPSKSLNRFSVRKVEQGRNDEQAFQSVKESLAKEFCESFEKSAMN